MRSESARAGGGDDRAPQVGADGSGEWGPRDWCASGVGGESFELAAEPAAGLRAGAGGRRSAVAPEAEAGAGGGTERAAWGEGAGGRGRRRGGRGAGRGQGGAGDGAERRSGRFGATRGERSAEPPADPAARARDICLRLLTGTAKTRKQLADALRKREIPDEVAEEVLSRFEDVGLIDDAAFAAAWVESRHAGRGLARRALAQELRTRGVAAPVVADAVGRLDPDEETATARALVERKLRATAGLDRQVRMRRLVGMLARRGYSEGLAFRAVREALDAEGESSEELEDWSLGEGQEN